MAAVTKSEIPKLAEFMQEFWTFIKQYYIVESDNDEYWGTVVKRCAKII